MSKILVVDDSAFMRKAIKNVLLSTKYDDVIEAENANEAVEKYTQYKPILVFMDILLPGDSGIDALKKIIEIDPNANVVMCSSMGQDSVVSEAMQIGAKNYIVKPFTTDKVLSILKSVLDE